jgi:CRP/FNR family transcriptional regulator, cyclic AMP receptor protein
MAAPHPLVVGATESNDDDLLFYLPCSTVVEYPKGTLIYDAEHECTDFYVIIAGTVSASRTAKGGQVVIMNVFRTDEFFGESALGTMPRRDEQAIALEKTLLMSWPCSKIQELVEKRPKLGIALLRLLAHRQAEFGERLQSFSLDSIAVRLGRSLMALSERLGTPTQDGGVRMRAFTQEFLAQYTGTSRELVTTSMNQFRRQGCLTYSRQEIAIRPDAMREWLRQNR